MRRLVVRVHPPQSWKSLASESGRRNRPNRVAELGHEPMAVRVLGRFETLRRRHACPAHRVRRQQMSLRRFRLRRSEDRHTTGIILRLLQDEVPANCDDGGVSPKLDFTRSVRSPALAGTEGQYDSLSSFRNQRFRHRVDERLRDERWRAPLRESGERPPDSRAAPIRLLLRFRKRQHRPLDSGQPSRNRGRVAHARPIVQPRVSRPAAPLRRPQHRIAVGQFGSSHHPNVARDSIEPSRIVAVKRRRARKNRRRLSGRLPAAWIARRRRIGRNLHLFQHRRQDRQHDRNLRRVSRDAQRHRAESDSARSERPRALSGVVCRPYAERSVSARTRGGEVTGSGPQLDRGASERMAVVGNHFADDLSCDRRRRQGNENRGGRESTRHLRQSLPGSR